LPRLGGLTGLRLVGEHEARFARVCVANTGLPTGDQVASDEFLQWRSFSQEVEVFPTDGIIDMATTTTLAPEVVAAYDAPYPDESYKAAARAFPPLVPVTADNPANQANREAWTVLSKFEKPFLTAFSDSDPISAGGEKIFLKKVPGTAGQPHTTIRDAGHFLQEDKGEEIAAILCTWMKG
jgi:haloalkane dehalogenase